MPGGISFFCRTMVCTCRPCLSSRCHSHNGISWTPEHGLRFVGAIDHNRDGKHIFCVSIFFRSSTYIFSDAHSTEDSLKRSQVVAFCGPQTMRRNRQSLFWLFSTRKVWVGESTPSIHQCPSLPLDTARTVPVRVHSSHHGVMLSQQVQGCYLKL